MSAPHDMTRLVLTYSFYFGSAGIWPLVLTALVEISFAQLLFGTFGPLQQQIGLLIHVDKLGSQRRLAVFPGTLGRTSSMPQLWGLSSKLPANSAPFQQSLREFWANGEN